MRYPVDALLPSGMSYSVRDDRCVEEDLHPGGLFKSMLMKKIPCEGASTVLNRAPFTTNGFSGGGGVTTMSAINSPASLTLNGTTSNRPSGPVTDVSESGVAARPPTGLRVTRTP